MEGGAALCWSADDVDFRRLHLPSVIHDRVLYLLLVPSAMLESSVPIYTRNLIQLLDDDAELIDWLESRWMPEEAEHGRILSRYIGAVWPWFDWPSRFQGFRREFEPLCRVDALQPTAALEMLARCVTETSTATYYRWLRDWAPEPVLREICDRLYRDEVRHFKFFLQKFEHYNRRERHGRLEIARTVLGRLGGINRQDVFIPFKHAFEAWHGAGTFEPGHYSRYMDQLRRNAERSYPFALVFSMLLRDARRQRENEPRAVARAGPPRRAGLALLWKKMRPSTDSARPAVPPLGGFQRRPDARDQHPPPTSEPHAPTRYPQ